MPHSAGFRPTLYFLVGPTAVGKTALSLACAQRLNADILSCDSLCVYRGMDIGTAKPTRDERAMVPHHGIDLVPVSEQYSVEAYTTHAHEVIADCAARQRHVLVVGGSGFYLKSFFSPVNDGIPISDSISERVAAIEAKGGIEALLDALRPYDPEATAVLDRRNPRRVAKALERCLATDRPLIELQREFAALPEPWTTYEKRVCLLERSGDDLRSRVRQRVEAMFTEGLLDEVQRLRTAGIEKNPSAAGAIGYRETLQWLTEGGELQPLKNLIAVHTDQLIRKQRIWFRRQIPVHTRLHASAATADDAFPG